MVEVEAEGRGGMVKCRGSRGVGGGGRKARGEDGRRGETLA